MMESIAFNFTQGSFYSLLGANCAFILDEQPSLSMYELQQIEPL